jgi:hypothetical protein
MHGTVSRRLADGLSQATFRLAVAKECIVYHRRQQMGMVQRIKQEMGAV